MAKEVMNMEYRREIAVVYTLEDALRKIELMLQHGFREFEIHIFAKNIKPMKQIKLATKIEVRQCGHLLDKFQSVLYNMALYEVSLRNLGFSEDELHHYGQMIEKGAILIVAQHNEPYEKTPVRATFSVKVNAPSR